MKQSISHLTRKRNKMVYQDIPDYNNYSEQAKEAVLKVYNERVRHSEFFPAEANLDGSPADPFQMSELYVVWFTKTLKNWKALVSSVRPNMLYFEVTHNGEKNETYVDVYEKQANITVSERGIEA